MKKILTWGVIVLCVMLLAILIIFLEKIAVPSHGSISDGLVAIVSTFIGIVVTMAITAILLDAQSRSESEKEKEVIYFQKKQETYQNFLESLGNIVTSLTESNLKGNEKTPYQNFIKLEDLIFQFGYLRAHMNDETFRKIIESVADILATYRSIRIYENYKKDIETLKRTRSPQLNKGLYDLANQLSSKVFFIASILHNDLYKPTKDQRYEGLIDVSIKSLLERCGLNDPKVILGSEAETINVEENLK